MYIEVFMDPWVVASFPWLLAYCSVLIPRHLVLAESG